MKTEIVAAIHDRRRQPQTIATDRAVQFLQQGEVVALPTETVYGLAADALRPEAAVKIFEAKDRPRFDPLIVHISDLSWLEKVANVDTKIKKLVSGLTNAFWPGPFTIVLPKTGLVPDIVTAGLDTVAVRISAHPVFQEVIAAFGKPLAAPSANRFGRISPTSAQHVLNELDGRIPLIVDGGRTTYGLESTVVTVTGGKISILRPGPITAEQLSEFAEVESGMGFQPMRFPPGSDHRQDADATRSGMGFQPMNPDEGVLVRGGAYLPHWTQSGATYAVTFRLIDSLPKEILTQWEFERRDIFLVARQQKRELTEVERERLAKLFSEKIEHYLDAGHGKCWLRDERIATVMRDALLRFESERYELDAWCIMPNHVHVVVRPRPGHTFPQILHSWKSFTAKEANRLLNRTGPFWQTESYDHLIRSEQEFQHHLGYVLENPEKAGLKSWQWVGRGMGFQPMSHRQDADATIPRAPGQLPSHYAPKTPLRVVGDPLSFSPVANQRIGLLAWNAVEFGNRFAVIRLLSERQDLREAAANLFCYLRELDEADLDLIIAEAVPNEGLGIAINDRLRRASKL